jgi:SAM-dependent methyltransferase
MPHYGRVGIYRDRIVPRLLERACGEKATGPLRERICAGLDGDVVEIGFGSGLNLSHYPAGVNRVAAVEPSDVAWRLAEPRRAAAAMPIERAGLDGGSLPFADQSLDAALSTWTLCTVPDAATALAELHRVLRPGGQLHFLEHGLAPDDGIRRWQYRLDPVQKRLFAGCHLTRPIDELVVAAGFEIGSLDRFYQDDVRGPWTATYLGRARTPA